ncbi:hypothetical protein [Novosphingobium sp. CECT 9465]|uniref:hypothetical protein n=1 Tax=Novosphingobium sp. CECT 9465 TaxID=2829794 RepID=UPI001E323FCC|nr:hypothetical protein [Novosphingobium sp. CECT 9465]CAH0497222.1 hypothetical protein NVSP9465_02274 [Novosphingobium sp. CECT 9465]
MPLQLFLNGLSTPTGAVHREQAIEFLVGLVRTARAAKAIDDQAILNCEEPLNGFSLGGDFSIAALRNTGEFAEESQYLKALNNRAPFHQVLEDAPEVDPNAFEYRISAGTATWGGAMANALGLVHRLKGLGLSLPSHEAWQSRMISLDLLELAENGDTVEYEVEARNASVPSDLDFHDMSIRADLRPPFANGADIWAHRAELFPSLTFIPRTRQQIEEILPGDPMLEQLWIKLSGMNQAIADWGSGTVPHPVYPFNVRPESTSRKRYVKFNDANDVERTFCDHCDLAPTEGRIHFLLITEPNKHGLVGHVGRKLGIG